MGEILLDPEEPTRPESAIEIENETVSDIDDLVRRLELLSLGKNPSWNSMPLEIKYMIVDYLNVLDRCLLRQVSKADKALVDSNSLEIEAINILTNPIELKITIEEASRPNYELSTDTQLSDLIVILKNRKTKIGKMNFSSGMIAFGKKFEDLIQSLKEGGISKSSLQVREISFDTEVLIPVVDFTDMTETVKIKEALEFCFPYLNVISIGSVLTNNVWQEMSNTKQWKLAENLRILRRQSLINSFFDRWNGKHLFIEFNCYSPLQDIDGIKHVFKAKPIGSTFKIHTLKTNLPRIPLLIDTIDDPHDTEKMLYVFLGETFYYGFVRARDVTLEGDFKIDPLRERRHLDP